MPKSRLLTIFQIIVSLFLIVKSVSELNLPPDCDERGLLAESHQQVVSALLFFRGSPHVLSTLTSLLSRTLFGDTVVSSRLFSIGWALLFLAALFWVTRRYFSSFSTVVVYLYLIANETTNWFLHSARGYVSLLALSTILFGLIYRMTLPNPPIPRRPILICIALFGVTFLDHHFTSYFFVCLMATLLLWAYGNRDKLNPQQSEQLRRLTRLALFSAPILIVFVIASFMAICKSGFAGNYSVGWNELFFLDPIRRVYTAVGVWRAKWYYLYTLLWILGTFLIFRRRHTAHLASFLWLFLGISFVGLLLLALPMGGTAWQGRFVLAFALFFVLALAETVVQLKVGWQRGLAAAIVLVGVIGVSFKESNPSYATNMCENYVHISLLKRHIGRPVAERFPSIRSLIFEEHQWRALKETQPPRKPFSLSRFR